MKYLKSIFLASSAITFAACAQSSADTPILVDTSDKAAIEQIVKDYLLENPEVVMDALIAFEKNSDWESIENLNAEIYSEKRDIVMGPDDAKVTIVEFFDYNCSFCKRSTDWVVDTLDKYPNDVRIIFKETPILDRQSRTSVNASKAALASARQGKYMEMHVALMDASRLSDDQIDKIAEENGVNVAQMREDMNDPKIALHVQDTMAVVSEIRPFSGTPFFLFEDEYVAGASTARLNELLEKALSN